MATKTAPRKPETVVETVETVVAPTTQDLDAMLAQKRILDEQIKVAKAALPTKSKLEREIERQTANPGKWITHQLIGAVGRRVKAGQDAEQAADAVMAFYCTVVLTALATTDQAE